MDIRPSRKGLLRGRGAAAHRGSRGMACLVADSRATASVGYALLLAAVAGVVLAGALILGSNVKRTFSGMTSVVGDVASRPGRSVRVRAAAADELGGAPARETTLLDVAVVCLAGAAVVVSGVFVWWMLRPQPKPSEEERPRSKKQQPAEEKILYTRLATKREQLWRQLLNDQDLLLRNQLAVRHVMTREPVTIERTTSGPRIGKLFSVHRVSHLLVCDEGRRLLGVVSAADHRLHPERRAEAVMKPPQASVAPESTLGSAMSLLIEQSVSFLPVLDGDKLCGVLTPTDLVLTLHCSLQL